MNTFARYVGVVSCLLSVVVLPLTGFWFWLEPLTGELTRLGWYADRDFGWRVPQEEFSRSEVALKGYDRYYDVVVFGDSFSKHFGQTESAPTSYWPNYLAETTGLSVLVLHYKDVKLLDLLQGEVFTATPPKIFVYEGVERYLHGFVPLPADGSCLRTSMATGEKVSFAHTVFSKKWTQRAQISFDINLGYARAYAVHAALRHWFGWESKNVKHLALTTGRLFSSNESSSLLVYTDDLLKAQWPQTMLESSNCKIVQLQNLVEANGRTRFVLLIAPDKLTAYAKYVSDKQYSNLSRLASFLESRPLPAPRVDRALIEAVDRREVDLYLPNGTHWGYRGHQIVATSVAAFIQATNPPDR